MINHKRVKELNINPERVRELIQEIEKYQNDMKVLYCHKKIAG